jgi:hypothetical protein
MDPRFAGSNLSEGDEFLRAIKIHSIPSFRGALKLLAPCHTRSDKKKTRLCLYLFLFNKLRKSTTIAFKIVPF